MSDRSNAATDGQSRVLSIQRRRFLAVAVAGGIAGLAGCSGDSPDAEDATEDGDSADTEASGGSEDTDTGARDTADESTPSGDAATTRYEPREGCTVGTATDIARDETVTVYPIHRDPEAGGMRFTYLGTDAEGQGEIRVEYPDGLTLDNYLERGERLNITEGTGIEMAELGANQIRVQFLRIPAEYDARSEWEPVEVELC